MTNLLNKSIGKADLTKAKGVILASLLVGAMALPFLMPVHKAQADNGDSRRDENPGALLGTWIVQVSLDPNTVPPGTTLNFTSLFTFGAGGGYVESNNGPNSGGPGAHGNWDRTDHLQFAATQVRLEFDAAHHFTGSNRVRSSLTLNKRGDELSGIAQVDIYLPDGTLLPFHPAGTFHDGHRMAIEPLN